VSELLYQLTHPSRVLDYFLRKRKLLKLLKVTKNEIEEYLDEFETSDLLKQVVDRLNPYIHLSLGDMLSPLRAPTIYVITRALAPNTVVETGVASGASSFTILLALEKNKKGALHSIDLPNQDPLAVLPEGKEPGWVIPEELRNRWTLTLGRTQERLRPLLCELKIIDIFLHDSEHTYETMTFEFSNIWPYLRDGGILLSDDIYSNNAFEDFIGVARPSYSTRFGAFGVARK